LSLLLKTSLDESVRLETRVGLLQSF
jgi:hypothetical protein